MINNEQNNKQELKRSLKARHINMIAIGGAIGTGLFLGSGGAIAEGGPGGTLLAFAVMGLMIYFLMTSLGEMATYLPISGSFETYASRFIDPAFGFAIGWTYWFMWAMTPAIEMIAGAIIVRYWFPGVPAEIWSALFLIILVSINLLSARAFGETEYWFSFIKASTAVIFILVGVLFILGITGESPGFQNWTIGDAPFVNGFSGFFSILLIAGFSFSGTELVGVAAGESEDPETTIPKATKAVAWRIIIFYIGAITVIGFMIPYTDENLLKSNAENIIVSPFTLLFTATGFKLAASFMNAVILIAVLSCANSGLYACTRMLYAMSKEGKAPAIFSKVDKRGIPRNALFGTSAFGLLAFLSSLIGEGAAYLWLINMGSVICFIVWLGIGICHYRFRRAFIAQGKDLNDLKFKALFFPLGPIFVVLMMAVIIIGQSYLVGAHPDEIGGVNWSGLLAIYIGIPLFFAMWFGYKFKKKTKIVSLLSMDLSKNVAYIHVSAKRFFLIGYALQHDMAEL